MNPTRAAKAGMIATMAVALGLGACEQASDAMFGARVRDYLLRHPEVLEEAQQQLAINRQEQASALIKARVNENRAAIERDPRDFVVNPEGEITVVEFFDYNCPYCRVMTADLMRIIEENPDVRFVFKEYPILSDASQRAAALALAAKDDGVYLDIHQGFYGLQQLDQEQMDRVVSEAGLDPEALKVEAVSEPVIQHLTDNYNLAQTLGLIGTPTFVIGDEVISSANVPAVEAAIDQERRRLG